jgi:hypothetical protein
MARLIATACLLGLALAGAARAQDDAAQTQPEAVAAGDTPQPDLTLPPRVEPSPADARLEPAPQEREDMLEAVVTGGQTDFRLPDLGTSFREEEEVDPNDRIDVTFLYLYDPDNIDPAEEVFPTIEDLRRVGFLRVFELRFGRRSRE